MPESLKTDYANGLMIALAHVHINVRQAAAEAIAAGMYEFPVTVAVGLSFLSLFLIHFSDIWIPVSPYRVLYEQWSSACAGNLKFGIFLVH